MFDIEFFRSCNELKKEIIQQRTPKDKDEIYKDFERFRNKRPFVFNVETTNACNMKCIICPRPALMKRPVQHMEIDLFEKIINQVTPHHDRTLEDFWKFIADEYSVNPGDKNENAFYFYVVSKSLTLHGYGEPPLDPYLVERIRLCSRRNIPTYFSCVPANINVERFVEMMTAGVGVIKFAMDALDDKNTKRIRGEKSDFTNSYKKICDLIEAKSKNPSLNTTIVVAMLELSQSEDSAKLHRDFTRLWADQPVYAYIKSQDNRWYYEKDSALECKSHYASQYCEYPWTSMTIMADGSVVPCTQDYNNEMVFGNANSQSLKEIWNCRAYDHFRRWHITGNFPKDYKCVARCDQKLVCDRLKER